MAQRLTAALLLFTAVLQMSACGGNENTGKTTRTAFVLDTSCTVTIYGGEERKNETLLTGCFELCQKYEALLSTTRETSDIYKLNARETNTVSDETAELLQKGLDYGALTDGSFDITIEPLSSLWNFDSDTHAVPDAEKIAAATAAVNYKNVTLSGDTVTFLSDKTQIDLGGIAKGYIADRVADYLRENGVSHAIVNLGGNVLCVGGRTDTSDFTVGIEKPFSNESIATVSGKDLSVVTSGVYERCFYQNGVLYHHILNPKTGYPYDNGLLSVTVIGKNSCDCDALSTGCFALGLENGMEMIEKKTGYYAIFITDDYKLHYSKGAEAALKIQN